MLKENLRNLLRHFEFFKDLNEAQLEKIINHIKETKFSKSELLISQGTVNNNIFFIIEGKLKVYIVNDSGKEINLAVLGPGESIGEISIFTDNVGSANCEVIENVSAFVLNGKELINLITATPEIAINCLKYLSKRLVKANKHLEELVTLNIKERALILLETMANSTPNKKLDITQESLATILSATRPRVSEALTELQNEGKISILRGSITIL